MKLQQLFGLAPEGKRLSGPERVTTRASTRSAGAQTEEEGEKGRQVKPGGDAPESAARASAETVAVTVRLRPAMMAAIGKAVEASPIEFANQSDFIRLAVEHELQRRGLVKTYG